MKETPSVPAPSESVVPGASRSGGRASRILRRLLLGVLIVLLAAEVVIRLAGWDPPRLLTHEDVKQLNQFRQWALDCPIAEAETKDAQRELALSEGAQADPNVITAARARLTKAQKGLTYLKEHPPARSFRFRGYWHDIPMEYDQQIELNEYWMRDCNYVLNKPPDTRRVVILGDSYTTAWEVGFDEMYHKRLATELSRLAGAGRKVEVPAFSMPSMGLAPLEQRFLQTAMNLKPDILMPVISGTLLSENYLPLQTEVDFKLKRLLKYFVSRASRVESDWLILRHSAVNRLVARTAAGLYIYHLDWFEDLTGRHPLDASVATFFEPETPKWTEAWKATAQVLERLCYTCRQAGIPLVVVTLPTEPSMSVFAQPAPGFTIDWEKVDRRFAEMCRQIGADFFSLTPTFAAHRARYGQDYRPTYDIHWNAKGHNMAAQAILEHLRTRYAAQLGLK